MKPIPIKPWAENPESITIGDHDTSTFKFKYYSPGKNISISLNTGNVIAHGTKWWTQTIENEKWEFVTIVGGKKGSGTAYLNVTTYPIEGDSVLTKTTINVVEPRVAHQIKFFDTDNEPLANNKLIAPKHICEIAQGEDDPINGSKPSTSNKCLKTTDSSAYVKFTYSKLSSQYDISEYSWVALSDIFYLSRGKFGNIC